MPLGKRSDFGDARYAGAEVEFSCDILDTLQQTLASGFDFLVTPLVHPRFRRHAVKGTAVNAPFTRSDLLLTSTQWGSQVVGKVSQWIQPDSHNAQLRSDSEAALRQELEWAAHLALQACILPVPPQRLNANYARVVLQVMHGLSNMSLWVRIPLAATERPAGQEGEPTPGAPDADPWQRWEQVRQLCGHHSKLGVILEVGANLPPAPEIQRWLGEPLRALALPTSVFLTNKRGYPTLSKGHQDLLLLFFQHGVQVILSGHARHSAPVPASEAGTAVLRAADGAVSLAGDGQPLRIYHEYLSYLFRKPEPPTPQQQLEYGYRDYLQAPLQPLQDNLESQTYETFERDENKYRAYEEAVAAALRDRVPDPGAAAGPTVLMVVGAGRGPLVRASLRAAERTGRQLRVFAVEKNPHAVVTLQNLVISEGWEGRVTVVAADMRHWDTAERADILVSELLGSFGDNELSPECLDGAQRFLREDGISIPAAYTSYLQPVTASKLWNDVRVYDDLKHLETPYVVKLHRFAPLAPTQAVFTFRHPDFSGRTDNSRAAALTFERRGQPAAVCHGFAGYFDAQLYGDVHLSTHPQTHTPDMFSWFPIYFPLREPVRCPAGAPLAVSVWRCIASHKVWYEWAVTRPAATPIHNPTGRSYYVGL